MRSNTTPRLAMAVNGVTATGASDPTGAVRPLMSKIDRTNSIAIIYSDQEKKAGTYSSGVNDGAKGFGSLSNFSFLGNFVIGAMWSGAGAESCTDANVKALFVALGYSIPWS